MRRRRPVVRRRTGFTLIEVLVALMAGALVVLAARALFEGVTVVGRRTVEAVAAADAEANGLRVARALVDQVDVTPAAEADAQNNPTAATAIPMAGDRISVRLATWCATAGGWSVRCTATLRFEAPGRPSVRDRGREADTHEREPAAVDLIADLSTGERLVLRRGLTGPSFRYLVTAADGGQWSAEWERHETPLAIAVVASTDTLLLSVGPRQ